MNRVLWDFQVEGITSAVSAKIPKKSGMQAEKTPKKKKTMVDLGKTVTCGSKVGEMCRQNQESSGITWKRNWGLIMCHISS